MFRSRFVLHHDQIAGPRKRTAITRDGEYLVRRVVNLISLFIHSSQYGEFLDHSSGFRLNGCVHFLDEIVILLDNVLDVEFVSGEWVGADLAEIALGLKKSGCLLVVIERADMQLIRVRARPFERQQIKMGAMREIRLVSVLQGGSR